MKAGVLSEPLLNIEKLVYGASAVVADQMRLLGVARSRRCRNAPGGGNTVDNRR